MSEPTVPATALVTGGAGAIGHAIAERLTAGRHVALLDASDRLQEKADALGALALPCDMTDPGAVAAAVDEATRALGPLGIVVHAAGVATIAPFLSTTLDAFDRAQAIHTRAAFALYQAVAVALVAADRPGRFIAISSISGARAGYGRTAYGTAKAALSHLMAQMALELGPYGITANTIAPGPVETPMSREAHTAEQRADYRRTIPVGRYGSAAEIAHAADYLASDEAGYVTGQTLYVDGGYMAAGMGVTIAQAEASVRKAARREP